MVVINLFRLFTSIIRFILDYYSDKGREIHLYYKLRKSN